jgi:hypothetical protein
MKRKPFSPISFISICSYVVLLLGISIFQMGCRGANDQSKPPEGPTSMTDTPAMKTWMALEIKFKPKTTGEMRDMTLRAIQKLVVDSILRPAKDLPQGYSQTFLLSMNSDDSLTVGIMGKTPSNLLSAAIQDTTKCNCGRNCGVCILLRDNMNPVPGPGPSPLQHILEVSDMKPGSFF